ncbi:repressor LexA [Caloramator fervidus]|uniref:LexA repressor n=1 Tax=Caloramator fervidus TaxID=29344 RepID=A0A1H5S8X1_9CLOT|nr:transcriptional repressor LexA [Caloramator fervidus]SEF46880.1 repressor LexA [Caloramator fervidus]
MSSNKDKQQEILEFIKKEIISKGYPPSVREICKAVGLKSTSTVHNYLEKLEKNGLIKRNPNKPRAIEIINNAYKKDLISIPIVGKVAAGQPIFAVENIEDVLPIPIDFIKLNNDAFILKVKGDSMIEKGIYDGDFLIVEKQPTAQNGDIVVALVDDNATVKTFYKENEHIRLQPENSNMKPIIVKECKILGKVRGLIRKY